MRLYNALCALIEAHADRLGQPDEHPEPQPNGADAMVERSSQYEPDDLHAHYNRDQGTYGDHARVGFNNDHTRRSR